MISVIIPVYNTSKYITICLDSIFNQTYKDYEVIIVNDGSTDNSLEICKTYERKYNNCHVYSQPNGGQNAAVINGINHSFGEYVMFVDSDDWVEPDILEKMISTTEKYGTDCVICRTCRDNEINKPSQQFMGKEFYDRSMITYEILPTLFCNLAGYKYTSVSNSRIGKLYRTELIKRIIPYLDQTVRHGEDSLLSKPYILTCESISFLNDVLYHYRRNNESVSSNTNRIFEETIKVISVLRKASKILSDYDFSNQFQAMTINAGLNLYYQTIRFSTMSDLYHNIKNICLDMRIITGVCPQKKSNYAQIEATALNKRNTVLLFVLAVIRKLTRS